MGSNVPIGFYGNMIPVPTILRHIDFLIMNGVSLYILSCVCMSPSNLHNSDYKRKWTLYGILEEARCCFFRNLVSKTLTPPLQTQIVPLLLGHGVASFHSSVTLWPFKLFHKNMHIKKWGAARHYLGFWITSSSGRPLTSMAEIAFRLHVCAFIAEFRINTSDDADVTSC